MEKENLAAKLEYAITEKQTLLAEKDNALTEKDIMIANLLSQIEKLTSEK